MSTSFCRWIPFHGAIVKETENQHDYDMGKGATEYTSRASWLPVYNIQEVFTHNPHLDWDNLRRNFGEWKQYRHLLTKDMHFFTPWHGKDDRSGWTAFAYHDRKTDEAVITAFRQEDCETGSLLVRPTFLKDGSVYLLTNEDTAEAIEASGSQLWENGLRIVLSEPKSCAVWHIIPR